VQEGILENTISRTVHILGDPMLNGKREVCDGRKKASKSISSKKSKSMEKERVVALIRRKKEKTNYSGRDRKKCDYSALERGREEIIRGVRA